MRPSRRDFLTGQAIRQAAVDRLTETHGDDRPTSRPRARDTVRLETEAMACRWSVILDPGAPERVMVASEALDQVHRVESMLTVYRSESELSRLNAKAALAPQAVTPELFDLLIQCREFHERTAGAFDPATHGLLQLWSRARRNADIPTQEEIDQALACSGMSRVVMDDRRQTVSYACSGLGLNMGAIGKGYAIDVATQVMQDAGMDGFVIHGGHSSLFACGEHDQQGGWPIGLKNPLFTDRAWGTILLKDQALATSGSNIQYFRHEGQRYGHILDPRTGWPAAELLSVSVMAPTAAEADALSTAFYVMGLEKTLEYCDTHHTIGVLLIPRPERGKTLAPVVRNIPGDRLFFEQDAEQDP